MSAPSVVPRTGLPRATLLACLDAAVAAPSVHNSQPWRFRIRAGGIDVFADRTRQLGVVDPAGRELLISVGAALLNLRIAVLAHGRLPVLHLTPDPLEPDLVGRVVPGPAVTPDATVRVLAAAIPRRRTSRQPFHRTAVPAEVLDELAGAAGAEGATLAVADPAGRAAILRLVRTAEEWQRAESGYRSELSAWTLPVPGRRDGIPGPAFGPRDPGDESPPVRDFGLTRPDLHRRRDHFEADPTVVVLTTAGDGPADWVRAGQALQRVLLTATVRGLAATPMTQPLETPELRPLLGDPRAGRVAQVILRLGYARPAAPVPRRPLDEMLVQP
jgi:nitroreductase